MKAYRDLVNTSTFILLLVACAFVFDIHGQNLVPNGSFEEGVVCPTFLGTLDTECANWFGSMTAAEGEVWSTPDWYHDCSEVDFMSPPEVFLGVREPAEGIGYAGNRKLCPYIYHSD